MGIAAASSMLMTVVVPVPIVMLVIIATTTSVLVVAVIMSVAMHHGWCRGRGLGVPGWFSTARCAHDGLSVERSEGRLINCVLEWWLE